MKHPVMFGTAALALAAATAAQPPLAQAQSGTALHGKTSGHCKLANVQYGREMYNGSCTIRQRIDGSSNFDSIQMGAAEPFLFATSDGKTWMHGPEQVRFRDRGHSASSAGATSASRSSRTDAAFAGRRAIAAGRPSPGGSASWQALARGPAVRLAVLISGAPGTWFCPRSGGQRVVSGLQAGNQGGMLL